MRAALIALALTGCGNMSQPGPPQLYGEVHIHGFTGGSHPGALFIGSPRPADRVRGDDVADDPPPSLASDGPCALYATICATCADPPPPIDGGPVHITGGLGIADVELAWISSQHTYLPSTPIDAAIFTGGEPLEVSASGAKAPGFRGSIVAPRPLALLAPASRPLLGSGDFRIAWAPDNGTRIDVVLIGSTGDGKAALIECIADDAGGQVTVPASLIAGLPAAPRDLQLEVSRDVIGSAASDSAGLSVLLHAGWETELSWHEGP
jgi:hypothetical protein